MNEWTTDRTDEYWARAMRSARRAELAAIEIYSRLVGPVTDLSLMQITHRHQDTRWHTADLLVDGTWIDVKNALHSVSSSKSYPRHLVKSFKTSALGANVIVTAFLSEYYEDGCMTWMGETSLANLAALSDEFNSHYLEIASQLYDGDRIPPWAFDYPSAFYRGRDAAIQRLRTSPLEPPYGGYSLPFRVLAQQLPADNATTGAWHEAYRIHNRMTHLGLSRPRLFFHVLDRFCESVCNESRFDAQSVRRAIFGEEGLQSQRQLPLAIYDPLETIASLLDVFERVGAALTSRLTRYRKFVLKGARVLQAVTADGRTERIVAYCGGKLLHKNVSCGKDPLYLGQNEPCDLCGYLVCHECGFCSAKDECKGRQLARASK